MDKNDPNDLKNPNIPENHEKKDFPNIVKETIGDFAKQIMSFRTTYLRAVARASVDSDFRKELTNPTDPNETSLDILKKTFGYECPWHLELVLHDDPLKGPRLNPVAGRVMTLPYWGESLTVYIPRKPERPANEQLDALAAYYHENPWFLRNKSPPDGKGSGNNGVLPMYVRDPPPMFGSKWSSVSKRERYQLGDDVNDFISFAAALFNAVALAWENETMWNELTAYKGGPGEPRGRTISILKEWLGYQYHWELDLIIQEDPRAHYEPYVKDDNTTGQWKDTTPPVLMLTLPWMSGTDTQGYAPHKKTIMDARAEVEQNKKNPGVAILGLALYNTNGPGYPFTCG